MNNKLNLCGRLIGEDYEPIVIAEIGINHEGDFQKAKQMITDAHQQGAECVKFQCHVIDDEMIKNKIDENVRYVVEEYIYKNNICIMNT